MIWWSTIALQSTPQQLHLGASSPIQSLANTSSCRRNYPWFLFKHAPSFVTSNGIRGVYNEKVSKLQRSIWSRKRKTKEWMRDLLQGVWSIVGPCFGSPQICCASNRVSSWYRTLSIEAHRPNCYSKPMKGTKLIPNTLDVRRILHVGSLMPIFTRQYCQPLDEFPERLWMLRWQRYAFWNVRMKCGVQYSTLRTLSGIAGTRVRYLLFRVHKCVSYCRLQGKLVLATLLTQSCV